MYSALVNSLVDSGPWVECVKCYWQVSIPKGTNESIHFSSSSLTKGRLAILEPSHRWVCYSDNTGLDKRNWPGKCMSYALAPSTSDNVPLRCLSAMKKDVD